MAVVRGEHHRYHGSLLGHFEHSALRAWNPYTKMTVWRPARRKPLAQRTELGGNLGGPDLDSQVVPRRDKAFFFIDYETLFENTGGRPPRLTEFPPTAERQGDFSAILQRFPGDATRVLWNPFSTTINASGSSNRTRFQTMICALSASIARLSRYSPCIPCRMAIRIPPIPTLCRTTWCIRQRGTRRY